ncbi:MAG: hypothetical protein ABIH00_03295 [Armatimonadota bacterium]
MRKAQIPQQLMTYIIAAVVAMIVLFLGYNAIVSIQEKGESVQLIQFKSDLSSDVERMSADYGSLVVTSYRLPSNIEKVCFVDIDNPISQGLIGSYPIIAESVKEGVKKNLFLVDDEDSVAFSDYVGDIDIGGPHWVCYPVVAGGFTVNLQGKGINTLIVEDFTITREIPTDSDIVMQFDVYDQLSLTVYPQNDGSTEIITFGIDMESNSESISDRINIFSRKTSWDPPLVLTLPLEGKVCDTLTFVTDVGIYTSNCSEAHNGIVKYSIDKI